jgi:hypothetical protein
MKFYTTESLRIGPKRYFTPEGFLVCEDVPIGRTGMMLYGPNETPVSPGPDGLVRIDRDSDELFSEKTIASFNGKAVTDDHPSTDVNADNWRDLAMGMVVNPHQGKGAQDDLMLADFILFDPVIIEEVLQEGKREVSSGYDNDYIQLEPGRGKQINIIGNHVALVQSGRCGSRCAIRDHATVQQPTTCGCKGDSSMALMFKDFVSTVKEAWKSKDEKKLDAALAEIGKAASSRDEIHVHESGKYNESTLDEAFEDLKNKHETHDEAIKDHENRISDLEKPATQDAAFTTAVGKAVDAALKKIGLDKKTVDRMKSRDEEHAFEDDGEGKCKICGKSKSEGDHTGSQDEESEEEKEKERKRREREGTQDAAFRAQMEAEEPRIKGARDSSFFEETFSQTVATAEILSPGIHVPTFDKAASPLNTFQSICGLRRKTLQAASKDADNKELIKKVQGRDLADTEIRTMTCDSVRTLFNAVGVLKKEANNGSVNHGTREIMDAGLGTVGGKSIADINKRNRERKW